MLICMVLSGLALALSASCLALVLAEKRKLKKWLAAVMQSIQAVDEGLEKKMKKSREELQGVFAEKYLEARAEISELKNGLSPDFEAARAAADSVNSFNKGLAAIFGYDPFAAVKAAREESAGDGV